jgi:hypothetical protein
MIKDIKFNGYTAQPSDYSCPDGDLSLSLNGIPDNGTFQPVFPPKVVLALADGEDVVYIHKTTNFTHYIVYTASSGAIKAINAKDTTKTYALPAIQKVLQVTAVGNTLVVLAEDGMHYILWKGETEGYLNLGTHLPELPISFGLQGEMVRTDEFNISFDAINEGNIWDEFSDSNKTRITSQVLAKVNKFIADKSVNAGKFIYPFLVRYAYRLFDGSLTMHSAPVLMICSSDLAPQVAWSHIKGKGKYTDATLRVICAVHSLDYAVILPARIEQLKLWKDIVRSVDIFISKPIYTYDQNGQCTKFSQVSDNDCFCVCKHTNQTADTTKYPIRYQKRSFSSMYAFTFDPTNFTYSDARLIIPKRSVEDVKADIRSCSQFFLLESIKIDELKSERTLIPVEKDYLQSLVNREQMTDDYDSHDTIIPKYAFAYNQRINIANIRKSLYNGYNIGAMTCYTDGYVAHYSSGAEPTIMDDKRSFGVFFFIKQDGRDIVVQGESFQMGYDTPFLFLYYPNVNAYKAVLVEWNYFSNVYEVTMEAHTALNGAFYFSGWDNPTKNGSVPAASSADDMMIDVPNKIYTSAVNDPYFFPLAGVNTVGTGTIVGISSAARALSQGQFGQFPLYCFSTDGIWALEVGSDGFYKARQPISRDVCTNPDSITQMDSSVVFVTDRGIMHISGSSTECLSDILDTETPFDISSLPHAADIINVFNECLADNEKQGNLQLPADFTLKPFRTFLAGCRIAYDYTHQHIIVFNQDYNYAYVYSMRSQAWGMMVMLHKMSHTVNSYPDAMAMDADHRLVNFSEYATTAEAFLLITRPLKLEAPDIQKTVDTIIQRGVFPNGSVAQVLYGSRDMYHWQLVWSSADHYLRGFAGTPYKYYRIAVIGRLREGDSLYGSSIQFTPRLTDQPR